MPPSHAWPGALRALSPDSPYASFWQGGFEGADHINGSATPLCLNTLTGHLRHASADYARASRLGLRTVRESAGWRTIERDGTYDFSGVTRRAAAAQARGVQVAWTCWHYGVPAGLDVFDASLPERFAAYCRALALQLRPYRGALAPIYTPVNEISFYSWAVCQTGLMHPHLGDRAHDAYALKCHLVRAALAGMAAIRDVEPDARFLHVDPLIHVSSDRALTDAIASDRIDASEMPPVDDTTARRESALHASASQFEAWDMLAGRIEPQLGGEARALDLVGVNYYHDNQWETGSHAPLHWHLRDVRRRGFAEMLGELWTRYGRPITVSETSHVGTGRALWLREVTRDVALAQREGVRIDGLCLYPVIDRPDWENPLLWHRSGLWDVHVHSRLRRRLHRPYARALKRAQRAASLLSPVRRDPAQ